MYKIVIILLFIFSFNFFLAAQESDRINASNHSTAKDTLVVLWSSGDPAVAEKVCLLYTHAAYKYDWFKKVTLIVWGPSANLLAKNSELQEKIKTMISDGIHVEACIVCADSYGVSDKLRDMGIKVFGAGKPLTNYLKRNYSILTF
jgi:hypothetical protein